MPRIILSLAIFLSCSFVQAQINGTVTDSSTSQPLQYANVWIKNKALGATTDRNGNFLIEQAQPGDTIVASLLGYTSREAVATKKLKFVLAEKTDELDEVVIIPMKSELEKEITSYKRRREIREQLAAGENFQYNAARFFKYLPDYQKTAFIKSISFVSFNALDKAVPLMISVLKADAEGNPTEQYLLKNKIAYVAEGREETTLDLREEKIRLPEKGFFVVLKRIYRDEYRLLNRNYDGESIKYIYQPSLGVVRDGEVETLWWQYGGNWQSPSEIKSRFPFVKKDLAINVELTN